MKSYMHMPLLLLLLIVYPVHSQNNWRNIGPGAGSDLEAMAIQPNNPDVVYIGGDIEGIFKTTDGGKTWRNINNNLSADFKDPDIYFVQEIVFDPSDTTYNTLFLCSLAGLLKTTDGGNSWKLIYPANITTEEDFIPISYAAVDPQNPGVVWAGVGESHESLSGTGTLIKSSDSGNNWKEIKVTSDSAVIQGIFIDPTSPTGNRTIYVSSNFGIFKSSDNGVSWVEKNNGLPHLELRRLDGIVVNGSLKLYLSLTTQGVPGNASSFNGGIYKSIDGADSWMDISGNLPKYQSGDSLFYYYWKFSLDKNNPGTIYTATTRGWPDEEMAAYENWGVFKTTDDGSSWTDMSTDVSMGWLSPPFYNEKNAFTLDVAPSNSDVIYWGLVWMMKSTNGGNSWNQIFTQKAGNAWKSTGLGFLAVEGIGFDPVDPDLIYIGYDDFGIFRSDDGANSFYPLDPQQEPYDGYDAVKEIITDPDNGDVYISRYEGLANATAFGFNHGRMWMSTDKGISWAIKSTGLPEGRPKLVMDKISGSPGNRTLYMTSYHNGVYKTTNSGDNWTSVNSGLGADANSAWEIAIDPNNSGNLFMGINSFGNGGALYKSTDAGGSWNKLNSFPVYDVLAIQIDKNTGAVFVGATDSYDYNTEGGLFKSTDGGATWLKIFDNSRVSDIVIDPNDSDKIYVISTAWYIFNSSLHPGIFSSNDGGASWTEITENISNLAGKFLALNPHNNQQLFYGCDGGDVWVKDLVTSIEDEKPEVRTEFKLEQNYPNPFNPTTKIKYSIHPVKAKNIASQRVELKIYDLLGREIETLVNEEMVPGNYEIQFDGSYLSSGMYFYRLRAGNFITSRKMILMK